MSQIDYLIVCLTLSMRTFQPNLYEGHTYIDVLCYLIPWLHLYLIHIFSRISFIYILGVSSNSSIVLSFRIIQATLCSGYINMDIYLVSTTNIASYSQST